MKQVDSWFILSIRQVQIQVSEDRGEKAAGCTGHWRGKRTREERRENTEVTPGFLPRTAAALLLKELSKGRPKGRK